MIDSSDMERLEGWLEEGSMIDSLLGKSPEDILEGSLLGMLEDSIEDSLRMLEGSSIDGSLVLMEESLIEGSLTMLEGSLEDRSLEGSIVDSLDGSLILDGSLEG